MSAVSINTFLDEHQFEAIINDIEQFIEQNIDCLDAREYDRSGLFGGDIRVSVNLYRFMGRIRISDLPCGPDGKDVAVQHKGFTLFYDTVVLLQRVEELLDSKNAVLSELDLSARDYLSETLYAL